MKKLAYHLSLLISIIACCTATPTYALSESQLNFYGQNNIFYYNPDANNAGCVTGGNTNYSGGQVLTGAMTSAIQANQAFYKNAADQYGFDWRIIAAIHVMENSAKRENPANGQGAYQLYSYTNGGTNSNAFLPVGPISDEEFQRQTNIMAELLANNYGAGLNLNTSEGIKTLFFKYNGTASKYKEKAIAMGFSASQAETGEGSPYVMNLFDARRDPNSSEMDSHWPGMYTGDKHWDDTATTTRPGAYTIFTALGGSANSAGSSYDCYVVGSGGGRLAPGASGMTLEEAQAFMEAYKAAISGHSDSDLKSLYGMTDNDCSGGIGYNCVSFSRYFINMYTNNYITNHIKVPLGNGKDIVGNLISGNYGFTDGGSTPRVYSIFSTGSSSGFGHTGVVLGINTNNNTIVIGEAACGSGVSGVKAREESLSDFMTSNYRYAYPNSVNGIY